MTSSGDDWVTHRTDAISDHYNIDMSPNGQLGQPGQFGTAYKATHIETGEERAVKVVNKLRFGHGKDRTFHYKQLRAEIKVMKQMDHPNIIKFYEFFEDDQFVYLVMEMCYGGELFDRIKQSGSFSEKDASRVLRQMFEGIKYLHSMKVAHCDLKPDNFLFATPDGDSLLKIIDFGMSKFCKRHKYFKSLCGTPYYVAPEIITGQYNQHADLWSLGVVMFVMLFGFPPFYADPKKYGGATDDYIMELVSKGFDPRTRPGYGAYFPEKIPVTDSAKDLISKLLTRNIASRYTAEEALEHPWLKGESAVDTPMVDTVALNLRAFQATSEFKSAVLGVMTNLLSDQELQNLRVTFETMDKDGDGNITVSELREAMEKQGVDASEVEKLVRVADVDGDGSLSYEELLMTSVNRKLLGKEERMYASFQKFDKNGDGFITADEIREVLGNDNEAAIGLIAQVDVNGDGMISYDEFCAAWGDAYAPKLKAKAGSKSEDAGADKE